MNKKEILVVLNQYLLNSPLFCKTTNTSGDEFGLYDSSHINLKRQTFNFQLRHDENGNLYIQDAFFIDQTSGLFVCLNNESKTLGNDYKTYEFFESFNRLDVPLIDMDNEQLMKANISFSLSEI